MSLRDLFHKPTDHTIGDVSFTVHKLQLSQFSDALVLARYLEGVSLDTFNLAELEKLAAGSEERRALTSTVAGCLSVAVPGEDGKRQLQPEDVEVMPAVMLAEALAVVMEVNADFFSRPFRGCCRWGCGSGRLVWHCSIACRSRPQPRPHSDVHAGADQGVPARDR